MAKRTCAVEGCARTSVARGWCTMHYQRWKSQGDPGPSGRLLADPYGEGAACGLPDCDDPITTRGWCEKHYQRWRKYGDPGHVTVEQSPGPTDGRCTVDGCGEDHIAKGFCPIHYYSWKRYGDPARAVRRGDASGRFWRKVDLGPEDECWEWQASRLLSGYGHFSLNGRLVPSHRFAYEEMVGPIPDGLYLDHLCRNPPCVNPRHLEPVTHAENVRRGYVSRRGE